MAYNRELSQFASLVEVNNTSKRIGFSTDLNVSGIITATRFYGSGRFLTDVFATSVETGIASDKQVLFSNNSNIEGASDFYYDNVKNNVGLGTTNPTSKLHVVGNVLISGISTATTGSFTNISATNVSISGIVTAQDFNSLSDINYKINVEPIPNPLNIVSNLEGVKFVWKETGTPSLGVIAQELEKVLPELVHTGDHKTVNYNGIIAVLIEAIKELKTEIEHLKSSI